MNKARCLGIAALLSGMVTSAHAVPISIDFSGYVSSSTHFNATGIATQEPSFLNLAVQASFLIETDGLIESTSSTSTANRLAFSDGSGLLDLMASTLNIGGIAYDVGAYGFDTGGIEFVDSLGLVSCGPGCTTGTPDQFVIRDVSSEIPLLSSYLPGPTYAAGAYRTNLLFFNSTPGIPDPNGASYVDLTQDYDALSIVTHPLGGMLSGGFSQFDYLCTDLCRGTGRLALGFTITSVTRSSTSVPEPGTLALFGIGLMGLVVSRKRRT